jgi:hypothetical protein
MQMVSIDKEITNPTVTYQREKGDKSAQGWSPLNNVNKNFNIFKVEESDMPFYANLQVKGFT